MYTPYLCLPASFSCFVKHAVLAEFIQPRFLLCEMWFHQLNTPLCPLPSSATQDPGHFLQWNKRENKDCRCVFNWKYKWCLFSSTILDETIVDMHYECWAHLWFSFFAGMWICRFVYCVGALCSDFVCWCNHARTLRPMTLSDMGMGNHSLHDTRYFRPPAFELRWHPAAAGKGIMPKNPAMHGHSDLRSGTISILSEPHTLVTPC